MKNTVKKILALVFVVAMVCSLAVPVFAADVAATVVFISADQNAEKVVAKVSIDSARTTVLAALKAADGQDGFKVADETIDFSYRSNKLSAVSVGGDATAEEVVPGQFETAKWVVALNGKIIDEDLSTVSFKKDDVISVYLYEGTFNTKFAQYDDSNIEAGIISFYYYDAEGNKKPLVGAEVTVTGAENLLGTYATVTTVVEEAGETNANGMAANRRYTSVFTTDEKGQIWIAPQYLDAAELIIDSVTMATTVKEQDDTDYDDDADYTYYANNAWRHFEGRQLANSKVTTDAMYTVAGATGDMTVVYVMVAAVAVITLGAVVIMKKKSVKDN